MIKHIVPTSVPSKYVVITDTSATIYQGTPEDLEAFINAIAPPAPSGGFFLLMESSGYLLLENGDKFILE